MNTDIQALLEDIASGKVEPDQAAQMIKEKYWPRERGSKKYTPEFLERAYQLHTNPEQPLSIIQVAKRLECNRKLLTKKLVEAGYKLRGQAESQEARRAMERLNGRDVNGWDDPFLRTNGR